MKVSLTWKLLGLLGTVLPLNAHAALVDCVGMGCVAGVGGGIEGLLSLPVKVFNILIGLSAAVLMAVIIWSGIRMTLFQFSDMPEAELQNAKMTLRQGLFGFVIVVSAYVIINTFVFTILGVNPCSPIGELLHEYGNLGPGCSN